MLHGPCSRVSVRSAVARNTGGRKRQALRRSLRSWDVLLRPILAVPHSDVHIAPVAAEVRHSLAPSSNSSPRRDAQSRSTFRRQLSSQGRRVLVEVVPCHPPAGSGVTFAGGRRAKKSPGRRHALGPWRDGQRSRPLTPDSVPCSSPGQPRNDRRSLPITSGPRYDNTQVLAQ